MSTTTAKRRKTSEFNPNKGVPKDPDESYSECSCCEDDNDRFGEFYPEELGMCSGCGSFVDSCFCNE